MSEWIALVPGDLPNDAISLWHVAAAGEHRFYLKGSDLTEYLRRNLVALIDAGAIPVKSGKGTPYEWIALHQYGQVKDTIVSSIIAEWEASKKDADFLFSIWFALPRDNVGGLNP